MLSCSAPTLAIITGKRKQSVSLDWTVLVLHDKTILQSSVNCLWLKLSIGKPEGENIKFQYSQDKNIQFYSQHEIFFFHPSYHTLHFPGNQQQSIASGPT